MLWGKHACELQATQWSPLHSHEDHPLCWFVLVYFTVSFLLFCLFISTMKIELGSKLCELFLSNLQNLPLSACNKWILYLWISIVWLLLWNCDPKSWVSSVISEVHKEGIRAPIFLNLQRKIWPVSFLIWLLQLRNDQFIKRLPLPSHIRGLFIFSKEY